ncbi:MAG TPA: PEP-CTERM sorting domain-containing protein [Phycisphaerae bacterium]|nr:PEP-CTERM sorting domain-containing protein [Phycisphaerae bacterium]
MMRVSAVHRVALFGALVGAAASAANGAGYTAIDLTPGGYSGANALAVDGSAQVGSATSASGNDHAVLWNGSSSTYTDLHPAAADASAILGVSGNLLVGQEVIGSISHAGYWSGGSFQLLPESGNGTSIALGVSGTLIVGSAGGTSHAVVWTGTPATGYTLTDLHSTITPPGYITSQASATDGTLVAGSVFVDSATDSAEHAAVWNLATSTFVDLQAAGGITDSTAQGVHGNQVVGIAAPTDSGAHAMLWLWDGQDYVRTDLNPAGAALSAANATNGIEQVGTVGDDISAPAQAYVWSETVDASNHVTSVNAVDLQLVLQANPQTQDLVSSYAQGIDAQGDIVGYGIDGLGNLHAVLWLAHAPEPATLSVLGTGALLLVRRRTKRSR